jgi:TetR/AcrR family acrAB operon transcriptional repressor
MARKTKEDALETRSQLLDAAEKVFFEKGFGQTSLMDIAAAADLTRGAIYWHFKNKSELFEAMADRIRLPMESLVEACAEPQEADPLGKLREFWIQTLREITRNPRKRRVLTILFFKCELNSEARQLEIRRQAGHIDYVQHIEQCLQNAVNRGQLPNRLQIHQAAIANHALISGLISNWLFLPASFDLSSYAETMVDSYIFMLKHSPNMLAK